MARRAAASDPVNVIMVTAEDALDTEVVPRLTAAGADLKRIFILKYIKTDQQQRQFLLNEDLERLEREIARIGDVGLVASIRSPRTWAAKSTRIKRRRCARSSDR